MHIIKFFSILPLNRPLNNALQTSGVPFVPLPKSFPQIRLTQHQPLVLLYVCDDALFVR